MSNLRTKIGFLLAGSLGFVFYFLFSFFFHHLGLEESNAAFLGVVFSIPPTYLLQRNFAFQHAGKIGSSFTKYCLLQLWNSVFIAGLAWMGSRTALPSFVNLLLSGAIATVVSYLVLSRNVFPQNERHGGGQ